MAQYVGLLRSEARTAGVTSPVITVSEKYTAAHVVVDVTAGTDFNLVFTVKGKDAVSGKSYTIIATPTISSTGTTIVKIAPEFTAGSNVAKDYLPYNWYVDVTASGASSVTYSVAASLM
jgi:hypothetical protein